MRGDDAVFGVEERIVTADRLCADNIQPGGSHFAGIQCIRQILFDDQLPAAVVDDNNAVFHP